MQKIKLKWIKDPNVRAKMIKHLFRNMGENLCDLGIDSGFLGHLKHKAIKKTIDKLNIKIKKTFCASNNATREVKRQPTECEKVFFGGSCLAENQTEAMALRRKNI